jgi:serine/threonine protein kinase
MRFIRGDNLLEAIRHFHAADSGRAGRVSGERTLALRALLGRYIDVCNAIAYAHSRGVLHRDLKPGNIMLGPYGETLVVDWGLAKPIGRREGLEGTAEEMLRPSSGSGSAATQHGSALGTPAYMSPEQAAGRLDELRPASDVYSLGATLYCLLAGRSPFEGQNVDGVLQAVQKGEFPPPRKVCPGVPRALEAVCLKAMALRPSDRYPTTRALAEDIEAWLADEPVSARREGLPSRAWRWYRRRPKLVAWIAAVGLADVMTLNYLAERAAASSPANQRTLYSYLILLQMMLTTPLWFLGLGAQGGAVFGAAVGASVGLFMRGTGLRRAAIRGTGLGTTVGATVGLALSVLMAALAVSSHGSPSRFLRFLSNPQWRYSLQPASAISSDAVALSLFLSTSPERQWRDPELAVRLARKAVDLTPEDRDAWDALRVASYRARDWEICIFATKRLMEAERGDSEVFCLYLAVAYWNHGDEAQGRMWYQRSQLPGIRLDTNRADLSRLRAEAAALMDPGAESVPAAKGAFPRR